MVLKLTKPEVRIVSGVRTLKTLSQNSQVNCWFSKSPSYCLSEDSLASPDMLGTVSVVTGLGSASSGWFCAGGVNRWSRRRWSPGEDWWNSLKLKDIAYEFSIAYCSLSVLASVSSVQSEMFARLLCFENLPWDSFWQNQTVFFKFVRCLEVYNKKLINLDLGGNLEGLKSARILQY